MQLCAQPGCPTLVPSGRCPAHALLLEHARPNRDVRRWYFSLRWRRLRLDVLRDAAYTCASCRLVALDLDVDHIVKHDGDHVRFWDRANLQALCPACHTRKTTRGE